LLAQPVETLQRFLEVDLAGGSVEARPQLLDRSFNRLLPILDAAVDLLSNVWRQTSLGLPQVGPAGLDSPFQKPRS
jgi:hypothetical protein